MTDDKFKENISSGKKLFKFKCAHCYNEFETDNIFRRQCYSCGKIIYKHSIDFYNLKITENQIVLYDTFAPQLIKYENIRRDISNNLLLQVKCTYCGKWYTPKRKTLVNRINAINGYLAGNSEARLYCSEECKQLCPIFNKKRYSAEETNTKQLAREAQPELRQMVFERDNWTCIKCGSTCSLHCHHVEGLRWEPIESTDIDKCVTLCKNCHKEVHKIEGCGFQDMKCL